MVSVNVLTRTDVDGLELSGPLYVRIVIPCPHGTDRGRLGELTYRARLARLHFPAPGIGPQPSPAQGGPALVRCGAVGTGRGAQPQGGEMAQTDRSELVVSVADLVLDPGPAAPLIGKPISWHSWNR